jgi:RHS repeat-associated protein
MFSTSLLAHERTLADRRGGGGRPFSLLGETPAKTRGLVSAATCSSPSLLHTWSFDDNGNRDPQSKGGPNKYDGQDRLTDVGSTHYTYTTDGRLQTKADGTGTTSYGYDVAGSLQSVGVTGKLVEYKVDALGRRVERKLNGVVTARWVYGRGLGPVAEFNAAGVLVARYVYARGRNVPDWVVTASGGVYRFVTDERGSVRLVVRSDGVVVRRQDYDVWGGMTPPPPSNDVNAPPLTFGFAGGMYDDTTRLVRFGARDYDPQLGRWTNKDPIGFAGGQGSLYAYAAGDPVSHTDPSGLIGIGDGAASDRTIGSQQSWFDTRFLEGMVDSFATGAVVTTAVEGTLLAAGDAALFAALKGGARWGAAGSAIVAFLRDKRGFIGCSNGPLGSSRGQLQPLHGLLNEETIIEGRTFGGHALDQMQNRGLMPSVVENAIQTGSRSPDPIPGRTRVFDAANNLTVVIEDARDRVVTVFPGRR